jgi:hypothetical protein
MLMTQISKIGQPQRFDQYDTPIQMLKAFKWPILFHHYVGLVDMINFYILFV